MGPFYENELTWIPALMRNYVSYKMWDKITKLFLNFNGATIEDWEWMSNFIQTFYWAGDCLSMLGFKLMHISRRGPHDKIVSILQTTILKIRLLRFNYSFPLSFSRGSVENKWALVQGNGLESKNERTITSIDDWFHGQTCIARHYGDKDVEIQ